ncbi:DUF4920 domain-containing protein [Aquimarina pacifica]|uniref:DUF4920 domain-containing protein n=1 Tax=Aquimarina pacifica TaxID=1296415 RepID=UPI00047150C8|nr:DUF4920 domain-containing protein [Aquimarina pacifica]
MKKKVIFFIGSLMFLSCNSSSDKSGTISSNDNNFANYKSFGQKVMTNDIISTNEMTTRYKSLKQGDTLAVTFMGTVNGVCQAKGCWMTIPLTIAEEEVMVKFKEYGFFVPQDIEKDTVIVQGKAFINEVSVEEQRHYAQDAAKTEEEIAAITVPKRTYSFVADGVLIKE